MVSALSDLASLVGRPEHLFVASGDVEAIVDGCTRALRPHRLTPTSRRSTLAANLHHLPLGNLSLSRLCYGGGVRVEPAVPQEDNFLVTLPIAGGACFRYGASRSDVRPGRGAVIGPYEGFTFEIGGGFDQVILRLDRRQVEAVCAGLLGTERRRPVRFDLGLGDPPAAWLRLLESAASLAQGFGIAARPRLVAHLEELVIGSLLLSQPHDRRAELSDAARPAVPATVRRAMAYMRAHLAEPLRLHEVATRSGISLRSLQAGFRQHLGLSPSAWLREERLACVHDQLTAAAPGSTTVTQVALDWGFPHLGEFAARYRARYGARPSDVLAKRRRRD